MGLWSLGVQGWVGLWIGEFHGDCSVVAVQEGGFSGGGWEVEMMNLCAGECLGEDRNVMTVWFLHWVWPMSGEIVTS